MLPDVRTLTPDHRSVVSATVGPCSTTMRDYGGEKGGRWLVGAGMRRDRRDTATRRWKGEWRVCGVDRRGNVDATVDIGTGRPTASPETTGFACLLRQSQLKGSC